METGRGLAERLFCFPLQSETSIVSETGCVIKLFNGTFLNFISQMPCCLGPTQGFEHIGLLSGGSGVSVLSGWLHRLLFWAGRSRLPVCAREVFDMHSDVVSVLSCRL